MQSHTFERSHALVDLVSDTATRPTRAMKQAMLDAPLGDEQKGEDPTVRALEERMAHLLGHESALFLPSATMANQIALCIHAGSGDEIIAHESAHVFHYEGGGVSHHSRAQLRPLHTPRGLFTGDDVARACRSSDPHFPASRAVVIENTCNSPGGVVWPVAQLDDVTQRCAQLGLAVHVDGARLWNAAAALSVPLSRLTAKTTSVQVCFSKGLGCPAGAVLALPRAHWPRARRWKQTFGGAMRQAGMLAGAMLYALDHHLERLPEDHRRAAAFANAVRALPGAPFDVETPDTNLVFFSPRDPSVTANDVAARALAAGVRVGAVAGQNRLRACFHLDVDDDGVARAVDALVLKAP
jgi:threonine aldolase